MLLSTSSRHGKEKGHILLEYFDGIETKNKEQKLKSELTQLAKLRDKLKCRANLLTEEINDQTKTFPTSLDQINLISSINPSDLKENGTSMQIVIELPFSSIPLPFKNAVCF